MLKSSKVDGLDLWTHLCYEHHFAVLINEENSHERYPPWVGAFWYGQPQEIAQWTPALGCKIVWQKGNAMYINLLNKPFIYKQDSLQNGSTNLLNKPLWQSGPGGDQLELFSSPGFKNIFTKTNWIVMSALHSVQPQPPSHWTVFRTPLVPPLWPLFWKTVVLTLEISEWF